MQFISVKKQNKVISLFRSSATITPSPVYCLVRCIVQKDHYQYQYHQYLSISDHVENIFLSAVENHPQRLFYRTYLTNALFRAEAILIDFRIHQIKPLLNVSFENIWKKECTLISQEPSHNEKTIFAMKSRPYHLKFCENLWKMLWKELEYTN